MPEVPENFEELENPDEYILKTGDLFCHTKIRYGTESSFNNWESVTSFAGTRVKVLVKNYNWNRFKIAIPSTKPPKKRFPEEKRDFPFGY